MPERRASESTLSRKNLNSVKGSHFPGGSRFKRWGAIQVLFRTISQFIYLIRALARFTPYLLCLFVWSQASLGYKGRQERERPTSHLRCVSQGWNGSGVLREKYKWSLFELCIAAWVVFNGTAIKKSHTSSHGTKKRDFGDPETFPLVPSKLFPQLIDGVP